jgi:hypothetical protein
MGRPSTYSPEVVEAICERLSAGEPLAAICRDEGMPGLRTVYDWSDAQADVSARIARARDVGEEVLLAQCLGIADDDSADYTKGTDGNDRPDTEHIQRSKLRIETRLKLLAKWNPKKWGDKTTSELTIKRASEELGDDELAAIASSSRD